MRSQQLFDAAIERYVREIEDNNPAPPYDCRCFFENWFRYQGSDGKEVLRKATLTLLRHDPFILITSCPSIDDLEITEEEIQHCLEGWSLGNSTTASFLEGNLRMAVISRTCPDREMTLRALAALELAAPDFENDSNFLELYSEALQILEDKRYPEVFERLLEATPPEWRAHALSRAMHSAVNNSDWLRYDSLRECWRNLPKNAHVCECHINYIANIDGLRALEHGDIKEAIRHLKVAVSVFGCPHLNSGHACLMLAKVLLERGIEVSEIAQHIEAVEQYCVTDETKKLRKQLEKRGHIKLRTPGPI